MKRFTPILLPVLFLSLLTAARAAPTPPADEIVEIQVSPHTILLSWKAKGDVRVTVHAEVDYSDVATFTVELGGFPALSTFADARGNLVAKFEYEDVRTLVAEGYATLVLTGSLKSGTTFRGEDSVRVVG